MFSVMIVEDEFLVRIGLKNMIDWPKLDMQVIAEAQNGQDAYVLYQELKPDLILTDIKMPVMDGLNLISLIREKDKQTKIIVLTCYQEFDLIYEASKLGVSDYILKLKMSPQEIWDIVDKVKLELYQEHKQERNVIDMSNSQNTLSTALLKHIIQDEITADEFSEVFVAYIGSHDLVSFSMCAIRFNCDYYISNLIHSVLDNILQMYNCGIAIQGSDGQYLLFLFCQGKAEQRFLMEMIEQIEFKMKSLLNLTPSFGLSSVSSNIHQLKHLYQEANNALDAHYYYQEKSYIFSGQSDLNQTYIQDIQQLKTAIQSSHMIQTTYHRVISMEIEQLKGMFGTNPENIKNRFIRLMLWPTIKENGLNSDKIHTLAEQFTHQIRKSKTFKTTADCFLLFLEKLTKIQKGSRMISPVTMQCIELMNEKYDALITLQFIADHVGMSANYISKLFKEELGVNMVSYLHEIRIEKAKDLLTETNLCSYEVATRVGFSDDSYFSRIFKQQVGIRPSEYRKIFIENDDCLI